MCRWPGALTCLDCESPLARIIIFLCWKLQPQRGEGRAAEPPCQPHSKELAGGSCSDPRDVPSWFLQMSLYSQGVVAELQQHGWGAPGLGQLQAEVTGLGTGLGHLHVALMGLPMGFSFPPAVAVPWEGAVGPWCAARQGEERSPKWKRDTFSTRISPHANRHHHILSQVLSDLSAEHDKSRATVNSRTGSRRNTNISRLHLLARDKEDASTMFPKPRCSNRTDPPGCGGCSFSRG